MTTSRNCPISCGAALNKANPSRTLSMGPVGVTATWNRGIGEVSIQNCHPSSPFRILLCFVTSKEILSHLVVELANYDLLSLSVASLAALLVYSVYSVYSSRLIFCWLGDK